MLDMFFAYKTKDQDIVYIYGIELVQVFYKRIVHESLERSGSSVKAEWQNLLLVVTYWGAERSKLFVVRSDTNAIKSTSDVKAGHDSTSLEYSYNIIDKQQ